MNFFSDIQIGRKYGVHRTTIWRWIKTAGFPKPVKLSPGCTRWDEKLIEDWESKRRVVED